MNDNLWFHTATRLPHEGVVVLTYRKEGEYDDIDVGVFIGDRWLIRDKFVPLKGEGCVLWWCKFTPPPPLRATERRSFYEQHKKER